MKLKCDESVIDKVSDTIDKGGIIVFPTDTVYGIGCDPYKKEAIEKIFKIKKRMREKSLPILAGSLELVETIVEFDKESKKIAKKFWPGKLTIVLKLKDERLKKSLQLEKIAIRIPNHQFLLKILKKCKFLIGTSANVSGEPSFIDPKNCSQNLKYYDLFLDGGIIESSGESTIIEFQNGKLVFHREGSIKQEEILEIL